MYCKTYRLKEAWAGLAVLGVMAMAMFLLMVAPQAASAAEPAALTVTGDGVNNTVQFTLAELNALPQKTYTYSGYNHWPSLQIFPDMKGPTLQSILDVAGLKDNATLIRVTSTSGAYSDFTKDQLLNEARYYFPDGEKPGDVVDWPPKRSEKGKKPVETIIALNETNGKLIYGQRAPNEPTCCQNQMLGALCNGGKIEVFTTPLEQWAVPHAEPAPGKVAPETKVTLQHEDGSPYHAIVYYTLDGSEPTYGSNILNISYPHFQPEMNKPVPINENVTIKTRTIGMGKLDSEIATYQYYTGSPDPANEVIPEQTKHFVDVENHWAKDDINYLVQKGIIAGMTDTEFKPEEKITRAQFAKLLIAALDLEVNKGAVLPFQDVPAGAWYHDPVAAAVNAGLITGYSDSVFAPDENITREQMAVMIARAARADGKGETLSGSEQEQQLVQFNDRPAISPWAQKDVAWTVKAGIMQGMPGGNFAPQTNADRAQSAAILKRFLTYVILVTNQ